MTTYFENFFFFEKQPTPKRIWKGCGRGVSALRSRISMVLDIAYSFNYAECLEDASEA